MAESLLRINLLQTMRLIIMVMEIKMKQKNKEHFYSRKEKKCKILKETKINGMLFLVDLIYAIFSYFNLKKMKKNKSRKNIKLKDNLMSNIRCASQLLFFL